LVGEARYDLRKASREAQKPFLRKNGIDLRTDAPSPRGGTRVHEVEGGIGGGRTRIVHGMTAPQSPQ
jgi:hypothetical protein